ncbi:unnamed protein product [Litomosoides sigmodontis]|uniref:WH1 domain-containing protein n=1 Tax=Litomosoides sigmodontis TaxID=42156 RepID=A0A3P6SJV5_LITSI|nr:unnamed protein product [Litomosoides sigmodontis]
MIFRFGHITCVSVQIYRVEGNNWREITKDFVLLHMYYDEVDRQAKLVAIDGVKLIVRGFVLSANLRLVRPTKKFVHFISSKQGRSEMYGFGFCRIYEVDQFLRQFNVVHKKLHVLSKIAAKSKSERNETDVSEPPIPMPSFTKSTPNGEACDTSLSSNDPPQRALRSADVRHIEKGLQGLSFASDSSFTALNINLTPSPSKQTPVSAERSFEFGDSTSLDWNPDTAGLVEQKQYQLWGAPPWSTLLEQPVYSNQATIASAWNSLLNH